MQHNGGGGGCNRPYMFFGGRNDERRGGCGGGGGRRRGGHNSSISGSHRRYNTISGTGQNAAAASMPSSSVNMTMDIDGFYFDPLRNRYFRIVPEPYGTGNLYTHQALQLRRSESERVRLFATPSTNASETSWRRNVSGSCPNRGSDSAAAAPCANDARKKSTNRNSPVLVGGRQLAVDALPQDMCRVNVQRQLGMISRQSLQRGLCEKRVRNAPRRASTTLKVLEDYPDVALERCQFLDASSDGKTLLGCWSVRQSPWGTRIMCLRVDSDPKSADDTHYGLKLKPTDNFIYTLDRNVVDICQAKMDSSVTCVLYVTVPVAERGSRIFLQPLPEMSNICDTEFLESPIYNVHWGMAEGAWSCAWEPRNMRVSLGLERCGMIMDVVSEKDFKLSSRQKNVLTQRFSKDGNLLFMGLRGNEILCCDLRLTYRHTIFAVPQTSTCCISIMNDDNYLLAANFFGEIKLWDLRQKRVVQEFTGLRNSHSKTPVILSEDETMAFAVGEDGTTRGWSMRTGEVLCAIPAPYPVLDRDCVPKMCYSNRWAGRYGNSAIVLGVRDELHFYELTV